APGPHLAHDPSKGQRDVRRYGVAGFLRKSRVAGEIGEHRSLGPARSFLAYACPLESRFHVLVQVLGPKVLRVPPVQPAEHLIACVPHPHPDLPDGSFEGLVVAQTATAEWLLDGVMGVVRLKLCHSPRA